MLNAPVESCLSKCVDLSDLYTNERQKKHVMNRLKEDEKEKKCLEFCASKWDELNRRLTQTLTRREIAAAQMDAFMDMRKAAETQIELLSREA